jgi:hypothetical protein
MSGFDQRGPRPGTGSSSAPSGAATPGKSTLIAAALPRTTHDLAPVQLSASANKADLDSGAVQQAAATGVAGSGGALPHRPTIQQLFGRHDVSGINAHVGGAAATASRAIGAEAYATGHDVAFASAPSLHTAAHEAAHVVQQRGGVQLKGGVGEAGDPYERHADAVADAVVAGRSAGSLLDAHAGTTGAGAAAVQREEKPDAKAEQQARTGSNVERLIHFLLQPPTLPWGFEMGYAFLGGLTMPELLATISGAADRGHLAEIETRARAYAAGPYLRARLLAAVHIIELASAPPAGASNPRLQQAGAELDMLSQTEQLQVIEYLLTRKGVTVASTTLMEGVLAMRQQQAADSSATAATGVAGPTAGPTAGAMNPSAAGPGGQPPSVEPGPWAPPGDQPIPFYIGNEAHARIAASYVAAHPGEGVLANFFPISSILERLTNLGHAGDAGALNDTELGLMPDIVNLTRLHLYEIKPFTAQGLGAAKATMCVGLFGRAGVAMQLGPMSEPGTSGGLPAPDGVYMFWSPEPGVIVYSYRKGRLVPVPVPEAEPATERRWRFELQPLTPQQRQAVTTFTIGAALLLAAMILLSPVGI